MNNIKETTKKYNSYICYTIIFVITALVAFWIFIKTGKSFVWGIDGFKQHYVILYDFNKMIRNALKDGISLFSWNMGLGLDVIGQYSYYILGDPFAYLSLLFPIKYLKYVYNILIILRMYCVGIAFIMYCRYNKKENYNTIIGAIIYTFSGYIFFAAVRHPYFTNPIIMLPLIFIGIDKILKEDKYIWFTVTIAILAIMNYYFLYMITILAVIYAVVKYIIEYRQNGIKDFGLKIAKTALHYIMGVMIAGIILLPTIYAFLNSDRTGVEYTYYNLKYYENLIFSHPNTSFWSKTYVSIIGILMIPVGILNLKKHKENQTVLINILISIIILVTPFLGSIMNGFSFQSNRWCFAYSFYIAYLVVLNLRKDAKYRGKELISMLCIFIIYLISAFIVNKVNRVFILISAIFAGLIIALFILKNTDKAKKICNVMLIALICGNITAYAWMVYGDNGINYAIEFRKISNIDKGYNNYEGKIKKFNKAIKYIKKKDNDFYRIGTPIYNNNNLSIKHDYNGLNTYLSIGNGYMSNFTKELLVLGTHKTNSLNELDSRVKLTTLLGAKYYIAPSEKSSYIPYGYKLIKELGDTKIYENKNNLNIGIFYDNYITKNDYNKLSVLEKEQALLENAVVDESTKEQINNIDYNKNLEYEIKNTSIDVNFSITNEETYLKDKKIYINFESVERSELYIYFDNLEYNSTDEHYVKVRYNEIEKLQIVKNKISSAYYIKTPYILFNLGYKDRHSGTIEIELTGTGDYNYNNIKVLAVPMKKYENSIKHLKQTEFKVQEIGNDYIRGNINNQKNGILQISTSYSTGWKAYVDGKEIKIINVNIGFIGIPIEQGEHEIYFKYNTPWIKTGAIISISGILGLIIIIVKQRKKEVV